MTTLHEFIPHFALKNPHVQTLLGYSLLRVKNPLSTTQFIKLKDGDQIALEISKPLAWKEDQTIVLLMPGTAGSHKSPYMIRMTKKLLEQNILVARLNFRGIATAQGLAKKISHGGASDDIEEAILALKKDYPQARLIVIGFSLSGNILLKLAGEKELSKIVYKIIAICPPLNLAISSQKLEEKQNKLYQQSIVSSIIEIVDSPSSSFAYKPLKPLSSCKTLRQFDELFTAPSLGFENAMDYYRQSSSLNLLTQIETPCQLLFSQDDPLIDCSEIQKMKLPSMVNLMITRYGGHMGFLQNSLSEIFWMDQMILHWIND